MSSEWKLLNSLPRDPWRPNALYPVPHSNMAIIHYNIAEVSNSNYLGRFVLAEKDPSSGSEKIILEHNDQIAIDPQNAFQFLRDGSVALYSFYFHYQAKTTRYAAYVFFFLNIENLEFSYQFCISPHETPFVEIRPWVFETKLFPEWSKGEEQGKMHLVDMTHAKWYPHSQFDQMLDQCKADGREFLLAQGYELVKGKS